MLSTAILLGAAALLVGAVIYFAGGQPVPAAPPIAKPPPPPKKPMRVTRMATKGFLRIRDGSGEHEEPLPDSPLGAGEFPRGVWAAADGAVYVVGKLYTGKPGPDDGFVWRRATDGTWSLAWRLPGRTFMSVVGLGDALVVGSYKGIACFDGRGWSVIDLPCDAMVRVWDDGGRVVARSIDGKGAWAVQGGDVTPIAPLEEPPQRETVFTRGDTTWQVFDRSTEIGEEDLSPEEEAEIRAEFAQVQEALRTGKGVRKP
jgi:hypothetical protein